MFWPDRASITETELRKVLQAVWECAARTNPMLLAKLRPDYSFEHLRDLVRGCLAKGMSLAEVHDHAVQELLRSAIEDAQRHKRGEQAEAPSQTKGVRP